MIFNFSSHDLSDDEKSLLWKGLLQFLLNVWIMQITCHLSNYFLGILTKGDKKAIKNRLKNSAFTWFWSHDYKSEISLTKNECLALNNHSNNRNFILQTSDKGNSVVLVDKYKCLEGMFKILNNNAKFQMLQFDHGKEQNYILNLEKNINDVLKGLKNKEETTEVDYNNPYPSESRPRILCGMAKVHKPVINRCPSPRPILSAINTPSYKLVKSLVLLLTLLRSNNFTIKDLFFIFHYKDTFFFWLCTLYD